MSEWKSGEGWGGRLSRSQTWLGGCLRVAGAGLASDKEGSRRSSQRQGLMEAETLSCSQRARGLVHPPSPTEECVLGWARQGAHGCLPTI